EGRLAGKPSSGRWSLGDRVSLSVDGGAAVVLELQPAGSVTGPVVFNAPGSAAVQGDVLTLTDVRGEIGSTTDAFVLLPAGVAHASATVNGQTVPITSRSDAGVTLQVAFEGVPFRQYQPVVDAAAAASGGRLTGSFRIPARVFDQLAARRKAWPIPWTPDDFRATWLVPERLLLFAQIAEPDAQWDARL